MKETKGKNQQTVARESPLVEPVSRPPLGPDKQQSFVAAVDSSTSMTGQKLADAIAALTAITRILRDPKNRGAFHEAVISYNDDATVLFGLKPASEVRDEDLRLTASGSTNIGRGLERALDVLIGSPTGGSWQRPIVVLMSDGWNRLGPDPEVIATKLKAKADLICVGFGDNADLALLGRLANTPAHAFRCTDGAELRRFFIAVGSTMSQARPGQSVAAALLGGTKGVVRSG